MFSASFFRRSFFSYLVSGVYFESNLKSLEAMSINARITLTLIFINGLGELVDGGWDLKTLEKNALLSLNADVLWPLDEASKVACWLNVTTDSEVSGRLLEERVLFV